MYKIDFNKTKKEICVICNSIQKVDKDLVCIFCKL